MFRTSTIAPFLLVATLVSLPYGTQAANPEHLKQLKETKSCPKCDLRAAKLTNFQLDEANLAGANLAGADLSGAKLLKANFSGADLSGAKLLKARLRDADMRGAKLYKANLAEAYLNRAKLMKANLYFANLTRANLYEANLAGADLGWANLTQATLHQADLSSAILGSADLTRANLRAAKLPKAVLVQTNLKEANLRLAKLNQAILIQTNLTGANLGAADLTGANLGAADLTGASLQNAKLAGAYLNQTDLSGADLRWADLRKATLSEANLTGARMTDVANLATVKWKKLPSGIFALRASFAKSGQRQHERELTYAIKKNERINTDGIEGLLNLIFFEWTSAYGLEPGRPLLILLGLIGGFWVVYMFALRPTGEAGIWRIWPKDRVLNANPGEETKELLVARRGAPDGKLSVGEWHVIRPWKVPLVAFQFSVLSAFDFGWRDLNVGTWIARMQPREYALRATGWVRMVSGAQSLTNVYLVALWALTYFGRPFG